MNKQICLILSGLILAACAGSSAEVVKTYELTKPQGAPYSRILVVGAHPDHAIRREFEDTLVDSLREAQVDAVSSFSLMDPQAALNRETVTRAAETSRADAVLVSRLKDVRYSATQSEARSMTEAQRREGNNLLDFFRYDYVEYKDPMSLSAVRTVVVSSDLYRVSDHTKVWSVESTAVEKETAMEVIEGIAASTSRQLQRDELVR